MGPEPHRRAERGGGGEGEKQRQSRSAAGVKGAALPPAAVAGERGAAEAGHCAGTGRGRVTGFSTIGMLISAEAMPSRIERYQTGM